MRDARHLGAKTGDRQFAMCFVFVNAALCFDCALLVNVRGGDVSFL
jgi:hypothetical protein